MDAVIGVAVIVAFLVGITGTVAVTPPGKRGLDAARDRWNTTTVVSGVRAARAGSRTPGSGGSTEGFGSRLAGSVRAGIDAIRSRRGGSSTTKPGGRDGAGNGASTPVDPAPTGTPGASGFHGVPGAPGSTYIPPSGPQDQPDAPAGGAYTGPEYTTGPAAPAPGRNPVAAITDDYEPVDGEVVPNPVALTAGATPAPESAASAALGAADTQEETVSGEVAVVSGAITYEMALAAAAATLQNGAALNNISAQTANGIDHVIACLQAVGMRDDEVFSAFYGALEAMRGAHRAAERAMAAANMATAALVARHGTAAAALAGNSAAAANTGFYTGGV